MLGEEGGDVMVGKGREGGDVTVGKGREGGTESIAATSGAALIGSCNHTHTHTERQRSPRVGKYANPQLSMIHAHT